jgi:predicted nucleotidyltransferase
MERRDIIIDKPEWCSVYFFGSFLYSDDPSDIDILIVYDPVQCPPSRIQARTKPFRGQLSELFRLNVDVVHLTKKEAQDTDFIARERCISIDGVNGANNLFQRIAWSRAR